MKHQPIAFHISWPHLMARSMVHLLIPILSHTEGEFVCQLVDVCLILLLLQELKILRNTRDVSLLVPLNVVLRILEEARVELPSFLWYCVGKCVC